MQKIRDICVPLVLITGSGCFKKELIEKLVACTVRVVQWLAGQRADEIETDSLKNGATLARDST